MDQIAIVSDIHENLTALKAALADIKKRGITHIYCLGDIISKGAHGEECVRLVREKCEVVVQGNCDGIYFEPDQNPNDKARQAWIQWTYEKLSAGSIEYLKALPLCYEFYLSGRLVRIFHSSPFRYDDYIFSIDTLDHLYRQFQPSPRTSSQKVADVAVYGHVHYPFVQKLYNRYLINPGSVGNSIDFIREADRDGNVKATTLVNYAILRGELGSLDWQDGFSFELISIPYNIEEELSYSGKHLEREGYERELREGVYRNMARAEAVKKGMEAAAKKR